MKQWGNWYKKLPFRRKVLVSHLMVSLIPVIILGAFCYFQTRNLLIQREKEVLGETLAQSVITLDSKLNSYKNAMENLTWDTKIKQTLSVRYQNNYEMYLAYRDVIDPTILRVKSLTPEIRRISIYSSNQTLYSHGSNLKSIKGLEELPNGLEDYKIHWISGKDRVLEIYCGIYQDISKDSNVVSMELDYEATFGYLTNLFREDYGILVVDSAKKPIFSYSDFANGKESYALADEAVLEDAGVSEQYVIEEAVLPSNGWTVYLYRPLVVVSASALSITVMMAVIMLLCVAVILFASLALSGSVVRPLEKLIHNMDMIEDGNFYVEVTGNGEDEIGHLINRFGEMVKRLNYMVNEVYKSKISQQQYEMKALQAQINPHFLYNSLSLINWKAIMADQTEISEMTQLLSTFYRTTLNKGKNVTNVKGEWDNTCSYVRIQNMLHSGKLTLMLNLGEGMEDYEILNLLLQPLVENAIVHGLDQKTGQGEKSLCIIGRQEEETLVFTVSDNGCGIPEHVLEHILSIKSKGYGVQNVHHRVQLYYGMSYGLSFSSREGEGTCVTLRIPKLKNKDITKPPEESS